MVTKRYNLNYLNEISGGDEEFILDMIQTFVNTSGDEISELNKLALEGEWTRLGENAHKFAPGLQFLGLTGLRPVITQLEEFAFNRKNLEKIPDLIVKLNNECNLVCEELRRDYKIKG